VNGLAVDIGIALTLSRKAEQIANPLRRLEYLLTGALKKSVSYLMDGDVSRRITVNLKDGAGRYSGELVCIEDDVLALAVEVDGQSASLLCITVEEILSVELVALVQR
jgi:hypothetical protein